MHVLAHCMTADLTARLAISYQDKLEIPRLGRLLIRPGGVIVPGRPWVVRLISGEPAGRRTPQGTSGINQVPAVDDVGPDAWLGVLTCLFPHRLMIRIGPANE